MNDLSTYQLLIASFAGETAGVAAVAGLVDAFRQRPGDLPAAASIVKNAAGALTIRETTDVGARQGAAAGALAGGLIGLLSRKRGTVSSAALGALLGGVAAHRMDTGIPDPRLEAIGQSLAVASSAAVAVVSDDAFGEAKALLSGLGATVQAEAFDYDTDFVEQMKAGDYRSAMTALANRAESMVAGATNVAVARAEALGDQARGAADEMKPAPQSTPADVAGAEAQPPSDAGGVARNDIDPAGAGLANLKPPL
jgi:uncharacterized membrane protein